MQFLIVEDHPLVSSALESTLRSAFDCTIMLAASLAEAMRIVETRPDIDLAVLDLKLPDTEGFQGLRQLRAQWPRLPILVLSGLEDPRLVQLVRAHGAMGYLSKAAGAGEILTAVTTILRGETVFAQELEDKPACDPQDLRIAKALRSLTAQQQTVLGLLGEGLLNKQIAHQLDISESTVKAHVSAILSKLEVSSRMQAVLIAQGGVFQNAPGLERAAPLADAVSTQNR